MRQFDIKEIAFHFTIEVIETCETPEHARQREIFWIRALKCRMPNGYNRSVGGETPLTSKPKQRKAVKKFNCMYDMEKNSVGEMLKLYRRIKNCREELDMSQDTLAKKVGYKSRTSIHKIEQGMTDLSQSKIVEIANALSTTPEYLMGWQSETKKYVDDDEAELVDGYRILPDESKELVKQLVLQLNRDFNLNTDKFGVAQKNTNNNGANIVNVDNSHFRQNVIR